MSFLPIKSIVVLGSNGMLGGMVVRELDGEFSVRGVESSRLRVSPNSNETFKNMLDAALYNGCPDYIVNCIGAIKPKFKDASKLDENIFVNAVFPHMLAKYCEKRNIRLIHITTDCVFSGTSSRYTETSPHDALDDYGKSKSLGEPTNCMVLRTSIIGPEWNGNKRSLVEWLLSQQEAGKVNGYTNHFWNGVTTMELSRCIGRIATHLYGNGLYHVFSTDVSKYDMLCTMVDTWGLPIKVNPSLAPEACDRTLRTNCGINNMLGVRDFPTQIKDMKKYICVQPK
jgi:dTDP-4-dehydrorhamnose reductase